MSDDQLLEIARIHNVDLSRMRNILNEIMAQLIKATRKHGPLRSHHEGYAVMMEEADELWDEIKKDDHEHAREECLHVGAMALRFIVDLY